LRREVERRQAGVTSSTPPLEIERRVARRWPQARSKAARVIELYLGESFGGVPLAAGESGELEEAMRSLLATLSAGSPRRAS
jgi:hypothetical protein